MTTIAGFMADMSDPGTLDIAAAIATAPGLSAADKQLPRGVLIYTGGGTPHVWTPAQMAAQSARYRLPLWVARPGGLTAADGIADGAAAASAAAALGMPTGQQLLIGLDMETWVSHAYSQAFRDQVVASGYWYTPYGSWSSVRSNYVGKCGYMAADWTDAIHVDPDCWYTQYASAGQLGTPFDLAAVASWAHVWDTQPTAGSQAVAAVQKLAAQCQSDIGRLAAAAAQL